MKTLSRQAGAFAVEFSLVVLMFFLLIFSILEVSRALYMFNTLQEVTRRAARAASTTDFTDAAAMDRVRQRAVFRDSPGELALGAPVSDAHVRIDYLSLQTDSSNKLRQVPIASGAMPACPARNRLVCTGDSNDPSCVRLVRVRICAPDSGSECSAVPYETLLPLVSLPLKLPVATSIVRAETLGYVPGMPMCH